MGICETELKKAAAPASTTTACLYCGLPAKVDANGRAFCCRGCEVVYDLMHDEGLDRFYDLGGGIGQAVGSAPQTLPLDWLEEAEQQSTRAGITRLVVDVQGVHCAACVWVIQELWRRRAGAAQMRLNPALWQAELVYDRQQLQVANFFTDLARFGYRVAPPSKRRDQKGNGLLWRLGVCAALSMNAMAFAFAHHLGLSSDEAEVHSLFRWLSLGLATVALLVGGPVFFRGAFAGLRRQVLHLDLPISLGMALAYGGSLWQFFAGGGSAASYFDTVTVFVTLMLAGRYLQHRAVQRNRDYLLANDGADSLRSRRVRQEQIERVPIKDIASGDRLLLAPGDLLPADAVLLGDQRTAFSLDWINGESEPRVFEPGDEVPAGAFLKAGTPVQVETIASAEASGLLQRLATPSEELGSVAQGRFWQWLNRVYVALVLLLAAAGAGVWLFLDASRSVEVAIAVLVVTCPCALGLATPLAVELLLARLRRGGIYVRKLALLEKARRVDKVVFDKTGTLTWGQLQAEALRPLRNDAARDVLLSMASSSNHPVSEAIVAAEGRGGFRLLSELRVEEMVGRGLRAKCNGHEYRLGSRSYVFGDAPRNGNDDLCLFTRDGHVEAAFRIQEGVRGGFRQEIDALQSMGKQVYLLSGDNRHKVDEVAAKLGIPAERALASQRPEDKRDFVQCLDHGDTMMVGDGLNDAPAFDAASCSGAAALDRPAMPSRADFFFLGSGAGAVSMVLAASAMLRRVVTTNLWLAGIYNVLVLSLAFAGVMSPLLCAVLMPASSLLLLGHTAWRLKSKGVAA